VTEPDAGSDVANIRATAVKKGNDVRRIIYIACIDNSCCYLVGDQWTEDVDNKWRNS